MNNTAKECRDSVRDNYVVIEAKSYAIPGWLKDLLTTAANEIERLEQQRAEAIRQAEFAKNERNKIGMEIRREWMKKCSDKDKTIERLVQEQANSLMREGNFRSGLIFALTGTRELLTDEQIINTAEMVRKDAYGRVCRWTADDDGNWNTECGGIFEITNGTPQDNKMSFCPFCGGKVEIV